MILQGDMPNLNPIYQHHENCREREFEEVSEPKPTHDDQVCLLPALRKLGNSVKLSSGAARRATLTSAYSGGGQRIAMETWDAISEPVGVCWLVSESAWEDHKTSAIWIPTREPLLSDGVAVNV